MLHPESQLLFSPLGPYDNFSEIYQDIQSSFRGHEGLRAFLKWDFRQESSLWAFHGLPGSKRTKPSLTMSSDETKALRDPSTTQSCGGFLVGPGGGWVATVVSTAETKSHIGQFWIVPSLKSKYAQLTVQQMSSCLSMSPMCGNMASHHQEPSQD